MLENLGDYVNHQSLLIQALKLQAQQNGYEIPIINGSSLLPKVQQAFSSKVRIRRVMPHHFKMWLPTTIDGNVSYDTSAYVDEASNLMNECFGGSGCHPIRGFHKSENLGLVSEKIFLVESWMTEKALLENISAFDSFIFRLLTKLRQESVVVVIDNMMLELVA